MAPRNIAVSIPKAQPMPFEFSASTTAFMIRDVTSHDESMGTEVPQWAKAFANTAMALEWFRDFGGQVVFLSDGAARHGAAFSLMRYLKGPRPGETVCWLDGCSSSLDRIKAMKDALADKCVTHVLLAGDATGNILPTWRQLAETYSCCLLDECIAGFEIDDMFDHIANELAHDRSGQKYFASLNDAAMASEWTMSLVHLKLEEELPSVEDLLHCYRFRLTTPEHVVNFVFNRIDAHDRDSPSAGTIWTHCQKRDDCLATASSLKTVYDIDLSCPLSCPALYGIPFSVKENIDVEKISTSPAIKTYSWGLGNSCDAESSASVVKRLTDAGAIFIGKTSMDQLATGLTGKWSPLKMPSSVFSGYHIAGGSSSGAAVSVGAGLVAFALATDTAGDGRVPAAYNGIVGFKPTKGTVSARGVTPSCRTMDTVSVMAKTVDDAQRVWESIAHYDIEDAYAKPPNTLPKLPVRNPQDRFWFMMPPRSVISSKCSPEYAKLFRSAVNIAQWAGGRLLTKDAAQSAERRTIDYLMFEVAGKLMYKTALLHERIYCVTAEFLRHNLSSLNQVAAGLFRPALEAAPLSKDIFYDQELQRNLTRRVETAFDPDDPQCVDVLIVPTTTQHPTIAEVEANPVDLNTQLGTFAHFANVVDMCGISIPAGWYESNQVGVPQKRLPFGITVLGGRGCDSKVLAIAKSIEAEFRKRAL